MHRTHGILVAVSSTPVCYHCAVFHFALRQVPIAMTLQLNSRADFSIENYAAVAWAGAPVAFDVVGQAREHDTACDALGQRRSEGGVCPERRFLRVSAPLVRLQPHARELAVT